jgi:hypothetical protein
MLLNILQAFRETFPTSEILVLTDSNSSTANCIACEIAVYETVDILVGVHGAGMTNMMFMLENRLVLEIVGVFDGRMLPVCGYHGPLASIFGLHHYIYYYDWKGQDDINIHDAAKKAKNFYSQIMS